MSELLLSIQNSGYLDFEPIIVRRNDHTVLEGNRRMAALQLLSDATLREELNVRLPTVPNQPKLPKTVRAVIVEDAAEKV